MAALNEIIPDADVLVSLDPDELGIRMLPALQAFERYPGLSVETLVKNYTRMRQAGEVGVYGQPYIGGTAGEVGWALREAYAWLVGQALLVPAPNNSGDHVLSRRAERLAAQPDPFATYAARTLPRTALREELQGDVWSAFQRGKFPTAVFEAMRAVEVAVREAAGFGQGEHGVPMIRRAFGPTGALTDREAEVAEQEAAAALFAGAIGSYKNPHSHRHVELNDPDEAAEMILLANHLLRIVASRQGD